MRYDLIVVGGGPAGLTAALYGARAGKQVLLLEALSVGGQILSSQRIENYPALPDTDGYSFSENLRTQVLSQGADIEYGLAEKILKTDGGFSVFVGEKTYESVAVVLATGLKHRKLGVKGEEDWIGKGISFCATCDGMFFRNREVAVLGGGNTAVQDALVLSEYCSRVYLIHRRATLRAERRLAERVLAKENVVFLGDTVVLEMKGENRLSSVCLRNTVTGETEELSVSGLFEAIGQIPQNGAFAALVQLDEDGYYIVDEKMATSCPGIFAAGDARKKAVRQLTTAVADGTVAALSAVAYVDDLKERSEGN